MTIDYAAIAALLHGIARDHFREAKSRARLAVALSYTAKAIWLASARDNLSLALGTLADSRKAARLTPSPLVGM